MNFEDQLKKKIMLPALWLIAGFVLLFLFRLGYGYTNENMKGFEENEYVSDFLENVESVKKNYAIDKFKSDGKDQVKHVPSAAGSSAAIEQKFEKIASVKAKTDDFTKSEKHVRDAVKKYDAIIQYENNSGNPGDRNLQLSIGVPPEHFDNMIADVKKVGRIKSIDVTKEDKTNEYNALNAKRISLEKVRNTLLELNGKQGKIDEFIALSNRILEVEQELQDLGVSLGDFDSEHQFCTVRLSLTEGRFVAISLMHRVKVALEWTINYYFLFTMILFFASVGSALVVWLWAKIKSFRRS